MGVNNGRCKMAIEEMGIPDFAITISVIAGVIYWGKMHMEEMKVAEEVWEPPVEIENAETVPEEQNVAKNLRSQFIGLFHKPVMSFFQKRKRSNYRVRFCQQQNRSKKSIRI